MRNGVKHIVGYLNNRQDPIKLGTISEDNQVVKYLVTADNVDIDDNFRATTRDGRTLRLAGTPHSLFVHPQDDKTAYLVESSVLKKLNTDWTTSNIATLNVDDEASFVSFNGEVVMTNNDQIGFIVDDSYVQFAQVLEDDNEELMPAGQYVAFDDNDGCLLVAKGSIVYKSKPWNPMVYGKRYGMFPMNGYVRMLSPVEDGWYIGTEKNVSFVKRDGEDDFTFAHISDNPPADGCFRNGYDFDENGRSFRFVVWGSVDGFNIGVANAKFQNLSYPNVVMPEGSNGKIFFRDNNGTQQYLATVFNPSDKENYTAPNISKTSISII